MEGDFILISGRSGDAFKREVVRVLRDRYDYPRAIDGPVVAKNFSCGEIFVQLGINQTNKKIHFFQSFYDLRTNRLVDRLMASDTPEHEKQIILEKILSVNDDIMEMLLFGDAIKRADAPIGSVSLYMPMFPYARQDKKDDGRVPISAKLIFDVIEKSFGIRLRNISVCELHAEQEQGFADGPVKTVPVDTMYGLYLKHNFDPSDIVIVSPDPGGARRAIKLAKLLHAPLAYIDKRRPGHGESEAENVIGPTEGKIPVIFDDILDGGGSLETAARILREKGKVREDKPIYACITHNLMSISYGKDEKRRTAESRLEGKVRLITTNTIPRTIEYYQQHKELYDAVLNLAEYFADLVHCNTTGGSFSNAITGYKDSLDGSKPSDLERFLIKF